MESALLGVVLDSSIVIEAERRGHTIQQLLEQIFQSLGEVEVAISSVTIAELVHGVYRARSGEIRTQRREFIDELRARSERQVAYSMAPVGEHEWEFPVGARGRIVYLTAADKLRAAGWVAAGFTEALRTPDSTLVFVEPEKADEIRTDQINCMGCLSACSFSNWAQNEAGTTGKKADPRSYCIQKTLQTISHSEDTEHNLMFAGHNAYRFRDDPFYAGGFVPTVGQLVDRILTGD